MGVASRKGEGEGVVVGGAGSSVKMGTTTVITATAIVATAPMMATMIALLCLSEPAGLLFVSESAGVLFFSALF